MAGREQRVGALGATGAQVVRRHASKRERLYWQRIEKWRSSSASRLYNEVLDAYHRSEGLRTPQRRVRLAPRVVIRRLDGKE